MFNPQRLIVLSTILLMVSAASAQTQRKTLRIERLEPDPAFSKPVTPDTLEALQQLALDHNPTLEQARAGIQRAQGKRIQAGLYPNPTIGVSGSEIGNDGEAGQQGPYVSQQIVRGGKLRLSRAVAGYELRQAESSLRIQEQRVLNAVRRGYYQVLVAEQMRKLAGDLLKIAEAGHQAAVDSLRDRGTRRDVVRARIEAGRAELLLISAENDYTAAWRRLSSVVGKPDLSPVPLLGDLSRDIPQLTWDQAWGQLEANSPLLTRTREGVDVARAALNRARVEPIPDVTLQASTQYDFGTQTQIAGFQVQLPLPIRNRNQGNITAAEADYIQAVREVKRLDLQLQRALADVFRQYATNRAQIERYRKSILPSVTESLDLHRDLYRAGEINYLEMLTAQRTYTQTNQEYVQTLAKLWDNVVFIDGLLLIDGLASPESSFNLQ